MVLCLSVCLQAPSHKYSAHSSHVTNVSFLFNDSHLISTGGKDTSIMQWRLVEKTSSLVPSDSALSLGEALLHNATPQRMDSLITPPPTTVATPTTREPAPSSFPPANGTQEFPPESPPAPQLNPLPSESTPPPSDSTMSLKDSLDPSDDTATPSDEGLPPFTPPL